MSERVGSLIALLLDKSAPLHERDDAAIDLGEFDDERALSALVITACDMSEDETLLASCGESVGQIWSRIGGGNSSLIDAMQPAARREVLASLCK